MDLVKGTYISEIYKNEMNGYIVGLMRIKEASLSEYNNKVITFTGTFHELKIKTNYVFQGEFVSHPKYGNQFVVSTYDVAIPTDKEELVNFFSSDLFPIGEKTADKIVSKLGVNAIDMINNDPSCLMGIPRLSADKIEKIRKVLSEYKNTSSVIVELAKMGFNTKNAISILKKYGINAVDKVRDNIYSVNDFLDVPFSDLDNIAKNNGYSLNDSRRLEALTIYLMNAVTFNNGDTYSSISELYEEIKKYTDNLDISAFEYVLICLNKKGLVKIKNDKYYLSTLYDAELDICDRICLLNNMERRKLPSLDKKINEMEKKNGINYDESQKIAISNAINNNLTIITGGPGTGKTTIIKCVLQLLLDIYKIDTDKIALLAPTGRAARKLCETTNIKAMTIHRYLKWDKESNTFLINSDTPNSPSYVIVDESSMIDTVLLASLFRGTSESAKFIFVGDYYQLPSVSQGQVLKDLIDSECLDVVKLNFLYRQSEGSYINNLAHDIKNKEIDSGFLSIRDDYNFIECDKSDILRIIHDITLRAIEHGYNSDDIQVLAPLYKGEVGIDNLNKMLRELLNPTDKKKNEYLSGDILYREGDKILQLVNDYDNNISNGDIGYIESIISKNKKTEITINYDGTRVTYMPKDLINIMHGYAISVHKSQGGEFPLVIIPFTNSFKRMLYNKLIYTAVTRAKEKLILVGDSKSFLDGVRNDYIENRKTTLKDLIISRYN